MLVREYVQRCASCKEMTPHSRRVVALPKILALVGMIGAGVCVALSGEPWLPAGSLMGVSLLLLLRDRERCWSIACERCRWKERRHYLNAGPTLDSRTTFDL